MSIYSDDELRNELFGFANDLSTQRSGPPSQASTSAYVTYRPTGYVPPKSTPLLSTAV